MKIIIVGAGDVGVASAKAALAGNDVHIIEKDVTVADLAKITLPVSILKGDASNPNVLRGAIERIKPDMILSAVREDGTNLFVCMTAKRINPRIRTVACIRDPDYLDTNGYEGVDLLISPYTISSDKMIKVALLENAVNCENLNLDNYELTTFRIEKGHDIVGRTIMNIKLPPDCAIVSIYRNGYIITRVNTAEVSANDRIVLLGTKEATKKFNELIGIKNEAREIVILGAGHQGLAIAKEIADLRTKTFVKILDNDIDRCREAAKQLKKAIVVNGNIVDPQFLRSENVERSDALISVTDIDERNLLACMTAMRFGIGKIISRYSIEEYEDIFKYAGIESVVGFHKIIQNEVTKILMTTPNYSVHHMEQPGDYFISYRVDPTSPLVSKHLGDIAVPNGINMCALIRKGKMIFLELLTKFQIDDWVLLFTHEPDNIVLSRLLGKNAPEF